MSYAHIARNKYRFPTHFSCITLGLSLALILFLLPGACFADIENLYAENYSSSVLITDPSNAYGAPDGYLRFLTRMGLSPFLGVGLVFVRLNLAERWPLFITFGVILSVLLYMELLIRRHRRARKKRPYPPRVSRSYPAHNPEA